MSTTLEAINIGPVCHATIPVKESGGLTVFRGRNGTGKSTMLSAIDAAVSGKGRVPVRDGQLKGEFRGFGVTMAIGRSTRRIGEAEVHSLDGKLSVADLVDPGIIDAEKADACRIKALVSLTEAKADASLFHELVGGAEQFDQLVSPDAAKATDLIQMAGRIKRDLETHARTYEGQATNAATRCEVAKKAAEGVDVSAEVDGPKLQTWLEAAVRHESSLKTQAGAAAKARANAQAAQDALEDAEAEYTGPSLAQAEAEEARLRRALDEAQESTIQARRLLAEAERKELACHHDWSASRAAKTSAENHARLLDQWRKQINADMPVPVNVVDLAAAAEAVTAARQAVEQGALARQARLHLSDAEKLAAEAKKHQADAQRLRDAAKGTDDVLSSLVAQSGVPLRVQPVNQAMRLVIDTQRGPTVFAELSDGERWRIALDIAIKAVGSGGMLCIPQMAWQDLDVPSRLAIANQLEGSGVVAFTAEATDGDLVAEIFDGE